MRPPSFLSMHPIHLKGSYTELYSINSPALIRPMQSKEHITSLVLDNKLILMQFTYALFLKCPKHTAEAYEIFYWLNPSLLYTATKPCVLVGTLSLMNKALNFKFLTHLFLVLILYRIATASMKRILNLLISLFAISIFM